MGLRKRNPQNDGAWVACREEMEINSWRGEKLFGTKVDVFLAFSVKKILVCFTDKVRSKKNKRKVLKKMKTWKGPQFVKNVIPKLAKMMKIE